MLINWEGHATIAHPVFLLARVAPIGALKRPDAALVLAALSWRLRLRR